MTAREGCFIHVICLCAALRASARTERLRRSVVTKKIGFGEAEEVHLDAGREELEGLVHRVVEVFLGELFGEFLVDLVEI